MSEKIGFLKWWFFKGDAYDIFYKLLVIYSSIVSIIFMLIIPLFFPKVFSSLMEAWGYFAHIGMIFHGWLITAIFCISMILKTTYDEYKEEVET